MRAHALQIGQPRARRGQQCMADMQDHLTLHAQIVLHQQFVGLGDRARLGVLDGQNCVVGLL